MKTKYMLTSLVAGFALVAAAPVAASTVSINFETGYSDNHLFANGEELLDASGALSGVKITTGGSNTMSIEASGPAALNVTDNVPDGFVAPGGNDTEESGFESALGGFFLRNTTGLAFDAGAVSPVFSLLFDGVRAGTVSAQIWDIDGRPSLGTEQWTLSAFNRGGSLLSTIVSPTGSDVGAASLNGKPWGFTFSGLGEIARIDFDFTGSKTQGIGVAFDNLTIAPVPLPAGGLLLLGALGGLSVLRRRRKAA